MIKQQKPSTGNSSQQFQSAMGGMAGAGGGVSFDSLFRADPRLEEYPSPLNFYRTPPMEHVTLLDFERMALDRLMVLLAIDSARIRAKTDIDVSKLIEPVILKHLDVKRNNMINIKGGAMLYDQRRKDHFSHFILRLAYCKTNELQNWFVKQEAALFRLRFLASSSEERDLLISQAKLDLHPCSLEGLVDIMIAAAASTGGSSARDEGRVKYVQTIKAVYGEAAATFYRVPWENVCELVAKRQILIYNGFSYVPEGERIVLVVNQFKAHLQQQLSMTAKALPRLDEDDRLMPVLFSLAKQSLSKEFQISSGGSAHDIHAEDVVKLAAHFPLCMQALQSSLTKDAHLKHNGRIQYGLFLKGIGLSLEEAMIFWRRSFSKFSDDEFNKKGYPYNIRYNYGMEGKRTNYTPYSCLKMIQSLPGPGESHGCPFRHFGGEVLNDMMLGLGLDSSTANTVVKKAKEGHYQLACTKLFEVTRGKIHQAAQAKLEAESGGGSSTTMGSESMGVDGDGNFMLLEPIDHPNRWFELSYAGKSTKPTSNPMPESAKSEDVEMAE